MKKALLLVLTVAMPVVQLITGITPLQSAVAQDPIFGPPAPPASSPATSPAGGVSNATIIAPTGFPGNSSVISNSSAIPIPSVNTNGSDITNATLPDGTLANGTLANGTLANGTFADGTLPGGSFGDGTFPNASISAPGDFGGGDQLGAGGAGGVGGEDQLGAGGVGGEDPFGLNETIPEATSATPPPITTILSNNTGDSTNPNVAVSGSHVFVAWEDTTGGNREILLISSLDGQNFTTVRNVTQTAGDSLNPRLAVSGNNVYLAWEDTGTTGGGQIMFATSSDSGATFTPAKNLSNNTGDSTNPNVSVSGNNVYLVWEDDSAGGSEIILVRSTNNGVNFAPSRNISNSPGESFNPRLAISESNVYVVWVDYSLGNSTQSEIMLIRSTNNGANFASADNLSNSPGESADPRIAVSEGNVYVVWEDTSSGIGNSEIKFVRSADSGATFTIARNLSNNNGISFDPRVAVSGSNVYVVWEDTSTATGTEAEGSSDIFLARSTNNGATFGRVQNLSNTPVESFDPYIATSRSKLFVIWSDDKEGNAEVIFTDKTRNIASPEEIGGAGAVDEFGAGGFGGGETDPFGTGGGLGLAPTDPSLSGGAGGFGAAPTDPSLSGGAGGFGAAPTDPSLSGGALGAAPTDPSLSGGALGAAPTDPSLSGGALGAAPTDPSLSGGAGGFGAAPTDPSLSGGALGAAPTDPSQMGGGIPPA